MTTLTLVPESAPTVLQLSREQLIAKGNALQSRVNIFTSACELNRETIREQQEEIDRLRSIVDAIPANLGRLLQYADTFEVPIDVEFVKCQCGNSIPRRALTPERLAWTCSCGVTLRISDHIVTLSKRTPVAEWIFDQRMVSIEDQVRMLVPLVLGEVLIEEDEPVHYVAASDEERRAEYEAERRDNGDE